MSKINERSCKFCGCTDDNCEQCVHRMGESCWWIRPDLCSACGPFVVFAELLHAKSPKEIWRMIGRMDEAIAFSDGTFDRLKKSAEALQSQCFHQLDVKLRALRASA